MSWAVSWVLLAGGTWLVPPTRETRAPTPPRQTAHWRMPLRALQALAALACVAVGVAMLGPSTGLPLGCAMAPTAGYLIARLDARPVRRAPDRALALTLDLMAAALRGGKSVASAVVVAAPAAGRVTAAELLQVAGLLRLGADPVEAWRSLAGDAVLAPLAQAACRSADSGSGLARGLEQLAADVRAQVGAAAEARAQRAGVLAMLPLGLCFLPAFVCLGIVPVVVGMAGGLVRNR